MSPAGASPTDNGPLPEDVAHVLDAFVDAAREAFAEDLQSIVLFGSAAEGRLRASSDVNVVVVVRQWHRAAADALQQPVRTALSAVRLAPMFVLSRELPECATAFADKFSDIAHRRRVLFGSDPFVALDIPRERLIERERQMLLNMVVRSRHGYVTMASREEQAARLVSDLAGPLRASAATLRRLEGGPPLPPKEALEAFVARTEELGLRDAVSAISAIREERPVAPGTAPSALFALTALAERLRDAYGGLGG
jgi:predicted nucleotidyltransferase